VKTVTTGPATGTDPAAGPRPATEPATEPAAGPTRPASTAGPAAGVAAAPADPGRAAAAIARDRDRIDELDEAIIALVRDRVEVSAAIQRARIAAGGRRLSLSRETEVIARYSERLGRPGTRLAMTMLELCRGTL
jgi:chorismate mutase